MLKSAILGPNKKLQSTIYYRYLEQSLIIASELLFRTAFRFYTAVKFETFFQNEIKSRNFTFAALNHFLFIKTKGLEFSKNLRYNCNMRGFHAEDFFLNSVFTNIVIVHTL